MQLVRLTITNFGVYKGVNSFELSTNGGSIVLFGGMNGSGKTTILNAFRLCLYGSKSIGQKTIKKEYHDFIDQQIHRNRSSKVSINSASIELTFNYGSLGSIDTYIVNRSWVRSNDKGKIDEQLLIKQNNEMLVEVEEEHWQSYLDDLIPPSIFNLFFFDGEKITNLMMDNLSSESLASEIKSLLGLDLIERLQSDLDIYLYQQRKNNLESNDLEKIETLENAREKLSKQISSIKQERANFISKINFVKGQIDDQESRIHRESSGYALNRKKWQNRLTQIEAEKEQTKKQIHDLSADLLPFSLVPNHLKELNAQLLSESRTQNWLASQSILEQKIDHIKEFITKKDFWKENKNLNEQNQRLIINKFIGLLNELSDIPKEIKSIQVRHKLSDNEKTKMLGWIDQAVESIPDISEGLFKSYIDLDNEQKSVTLALRKIPSDEILQPYVDNLNRLYQKLGNLEGQLIKIDERIKSLENYYIETCNLFEKAYLAIRSEEKLEERLELVVRTQKALEKYLFEQTRRKIHLLEDLLVARFRELSHKEHLISRAIIDLNDLNITLFDRLDNIVPKDQLSAGEQQMFAISMIWALKQLSGRPYPVVIDTPLGRLDSGHRDNLINHYFPNVSHQVILFSTDTEVDRSYFEELQPFISHSYHLDFDATQGYTKIKTGYFWSIGAIDATYSN